MMMDDATEHDAADDPLVDSPDAAATEPDGETLTGSGAGWLPPPGEDPGPGPNWLDGRAITTVWRETLTFTARALTATVKDARFSHIRLGAGWKHAPRPETDADVDQAIAAKLHLGLHIVPVLAEAKLLVLDPQDAEGIPPWPSVGHAVATAHKQICPCRRSSWTLNEPMDVRSDGKPMAGRFR